MLNIGPQELIVVLIIALLVVGPSRLPELGRSIGKALREFRKVQDEVKDTFRFDANDGPPPPARAPGPGPSRPPAARPTTNGVAPDPGEPDVSMPAPAEARATEAPATEGPADGAPGDGAATGPEPSA
jgi:TatA/E family protein of Tat protein translocase